LPLLHLASPDLPALAFSLGGLSRSCGLPQMKLGWIAAGGPAPLRAQAFDRLETIADSYLSVGAPVLAALPERYCHAAALRWSKLGADGIVVGGEAYLVKENRFRLVGNVSRCRRPPVRPDVRIPDRPDTRTLGLRGLGAGMSSARPHGPHVRPVD
jgi:hypothetical protein